jgi:hypothetical protein
MPKMLYDVYYAKQMQFLDRYIRKTLESGDQERLARLKQKQSQQSIHFLDEFLSIEKGKELETTRIGYPPLSNVQYHPSQLVLAPFNVRPENRRLSRYRLVHGPVDFYLGSQLDEATEIPVITACAPNLMGSSQVDLDEFSFGGASDRVLKNNEYKAECAKLAEFIVGTAKQQGHTRLIMPGFGVGVYIKQLNHFSKKTARELMYTAFAEAALKHEIHVDWVLWARDTKSAHTKNILTSYSKDNPFMQPVVHEDMMLYAHEFTQKQENIVLLNPGSDRTIGGKYITKNPITLEEQMAQQSDLVLLHSEFNQPMVDQFKQDFALRKQLKLTSADKQQKVMDGSVPDASSADFKAVASGIKNNLGINEAPWISAADKNYKISFKNLKNAQSLVTLLTTYNVSARDGKKKKVQPDSGYSVVYLTESQYKVLADRALLKIPHMVPFSLPASATFFSNHKGNCCLNRSQRADIKALIHLLKTEKTSFWSLNHQRKDIKINALKMLLKESVNYNNVSDLAKDVLGKYPDADKGILSNRTGELLLKLRDQSESSVPRI